MAVPMRANAAVYRRLRCPHSGLRVHLGPGQGNYLEGWLNVDANFLTARTDLWADFSKTLPFRDESVDVIYSHHVIEHLRDPDRHFAEMFRVLRPGGAIRVCAPHLGNACRKYLEGDSSWFFDFPETRRSVGGRFANFIFCVGEHVTALDETYLKELAEDAGFDDIAFCLSARETTLARLGIGKDVFAKEDKDDPSCPHTVVLEAVKPRGRRQKARPQ